MYLCHCSALVRNFFKLSEMRFVIIIIKKLLRMKFAAELITAKASEVKE